MITDADRAKAQDLARMFGGRGLRTERQVQIFAEIVAKMRERSKATR